MNAPDIAALSREALEAIQQRGERADRVLDKLLRKHRLDSASRATLARRVLGCCWMKGRLDHLLGACSAAWAEDPVRWRLAAHAVLEERSTPAEAAARYGLLDAHALDALLGPPAWPEDPVERLAAERSLPSWLAWLWFDELGPAAADALAEACNRPGPIAVRANRLRGDRAALREALRAEGLASEECRFSPDGLVLQGRPNIFGSAAWRAGLFEVQDEGSQLLALLCAAKPGERAVDFCAGAGGKTLALAAQMENRGELWALDTDARRLGDMAPRLRRAGVDIVRTASLGAAGEPPPEAGDADLVLVDAPCSELGTLRRGPDARWRIRPEDLASLPETQGQILDRATRLLRPGGRLVYATCTLRRAENEELAERFERAHPELRPVEIGELLGAELAARLGCEGRRLNLRPDLHGTDGFFACAWARR